MRGTTRNGDIFFQHREACNKYYDAARPLGSTWAVSTRSWAPTTSCLVLRRSEATASSSQWAPSATCRGSHRLPHRQGREGRSGEGPTVPSLRAPTSCLRPFPLPRRRSPCWTAPRSRRSGRASVLDVVTVRANAGTRCQVIGGRYGLGSKDTPPASVFAVYKS